MNADQIKNKLIYLLNRTRLRFIFKYLIRYKYKKAGKILSELSFDEKNKFWKYRVDGCFFIQDNPGWIYSWNEFYKDLSKTFCFHYMPVEGDIIINIGAGLGEETIVLSKLAGDKGRVISIEANPVISKILQDVVRANNLKNVTVMNVAISDKDGTIKIKPIFDDYMANGISNDEGIEVPAFSLDSIILQKHLDKVDLLIMNIEGAEQLAIKGLKSEVKRVRNFAVSCHDFRFKDTQDPFHKTKEKVENYFRENNCTMLYNDSNVPAISNIVYAQNK
jgi:FkbM family methyltransferase